MAKLEVLIPVYNTDAYLKRCLDSILKQTYKDFKITIVDDKSTDNSLAILKKYEEDYPEFITVIESPVNVGAAEARNIALRTVNSEYITFIDSDDTINIQLFEKVNDIINNYHPDIIVANTCMDYYGLNLNFLGMKRDSNTKDQFINPMKYKKHLYQDRPTVTAKFIKRKLITTEFTKSLKWEDYPFIIPYLATVNSIYYLSDVGYYYTVNPFGTTTRDIFKFPSKVLDIFTGSDIINKTIGQDLCDYYKDELRTLRTLNCLQRVRDLSLAINLSKEDKVLLANYLVNLINIREGNYQEVDYYQYQKRKTLLYRIRMQYVEKFLSPDLLQETDEVKIKNKIKFITKKYE